MRVGPSHGRGHQFESGIAHRKHLSTALSPYRARVRIETAGRKWRLSPPFEPALFGFCDGYSRSTPFRIDLNGIGVHEAADRIAARLGGREFVEPVAPRRSGGRQLSGLLSSCSRHGRSTAPDPSTSAAARSPRRSGVASSFLAQARWGGDGRADACHREERGIPNRDPERRTDGVRDSARSGAFRRGSLSNGHGRARIGNE